MRTTLLLAIAALSTVSVAIPARAAGFQNVIVATTKDADTTETHIPADAPKVYVSAEPVDVAASSKVTFTWVSVDSNGVAPANYTIDKADVVVGSNNEVDSELSEPTAGWPKGTYRVDLAVDGTVLNSANFSIP